MTMREALTTSCALNSERPTTRVYSRAILLSGGYRPDKHYSNITRVAGFTQPGSKKQLIL